MGSVVAFPAGARTPRPTIVQIHFDFDRWTIRKFALPHGVFCGREEFPSEIAARLEAARRVREEGMTLWPDLEPTPTCGLSDDGGDCA